MTGHNHYPDCLCGWCVNLRGRLREPKPLYTSAAQPQKFTTYTSFTNPNAFCPECGECVFFYQSPHGGRVFFDELGPPWTKHPCTDNSDKPVRWRATTGDRADRVITWEREGWEPILIRSSRLEMNWHCVPVQNLKTRLYFDALANVPLRLDGEMFAMMLPWNERGWSTISYISLNPDITIHELPIFERKRYFRSSRSMAVAERAKP